VVSLSLTALAQDVKVSAGFFADSITVGDKTSFYLTARYPRNVTVLFPDSTYAFAPFEFEAKRYFPTTTSDNVSYDSVIYTLSTFEIDRVQRLSLPVFEITDLDSVRHFSSADSVLLTPLVTMSLDTIPVDQLPLKLNVAYQRLSTIFNYPVVLIIVSVVILLCAVGWFIFGKKIIRHFRAKRMIKFHQKFLASYSALVASVKNTFSPVSGAGYGPLESIHGETGIKTVYQTHHAGNPGVRPG
jgi:hypothetical protein